MLDLNYVIEHKLCMGCGLCAIDPEVNGMIYSRKNDCNIPVNKFLDESTLASKVCPGKGYSIIGYGKQLYGEQHYDLNLGNYQYLTAAHTSDSSILQNASSGGVVTGILLYMLRHNVVDKVSVTQFCCDRQGVHTHTFLTDSEEEVLKSQGSKYCPVDLSNLMEELHNFEGRVAIMATPCAIAGIRTIQREAPNYIKSDIVFTVANFCGGFKSFKNIKRLAEIHKVDYYNLKEFRFRGDGQPGSLKFIDNNGKVASTAYPKYVGLNGYSKMSRCFVCPDATGELADFSCGDAWIPRFQNDSHPWSMVICRNKEATELIKDMEKQGDVILKKVSKEEIIVSQRINLKSKKIRQKARMVVYKMLGRGVPLFDGGYSDELSSISTECKVVIKHWLTLCAEKTGLYMCLYGYKKMNNKK